MQANAEQQIKPDLPYLPHRKTGKLDFWERSIVLAGPCTCGTSFKVFKLPFPEFLLSKLPLGIKKYEGFDQRPVLERPPSRQVSWQFTHPFVFRLLSMTLYLGQVYIRIFARAKQHD